MMRVEGGDDNNVGGTATPVGTVPCPDRPDHEWTAARVGTDVQWWQCTRCAVLATTAELDEANGATPDYICLGCGLTCDRAAHGPTLSGLGLCVDCHADPGWADGGVIRFAPGEVTLDLATGEFERRQS